MRDRDIRLALRAEIERIHRADDEARVLDELALCLGAARVDMVVVNGTLDGFEIKSAGDTLSRLPQQCETYGRVLDHATLVVEPAHYERALELVPPWWGVWLVREVGGRVSLQPVRDAQPNPAPDPLAQAQLLWRDEGLTVLERHGIDRGMRSKARRQIWAAIVSSLSPEQVAGEVRACLKSRTGWREN